MASRFIRICTTHRVSEQIIRAKYYGTKLYYEDWFGATGKIKHENVKSVNHFELFPLLLQTKVLNYDVFLNLHSLKK